MVYVREGAAKPESGWFVSTSICDSWRLMFSKMDFRSTGTPLREWYIGLFGFILCIGKVG